VNIVSHIKLQVDESYLDAVLNILDSLKEGMIHNIEVVDDNSYLQSKQFQKDKAYMQNALKQIDSAKEKLLSSDEYHLEMSNFRENLKNRYANS